MQLKFKKQTAIFCLISVAFIMECDLLFSVHLICKCINLVQLILEIKREIIWKDH